MPTPRKKPSPLLVRIVAVTLAILAAPGLFQGCSGCTCEECFGQGVEREVTREAAKGYVYKAPLGDTERELRGLLTDEGFEPPTGAVTRTATLRAHRKGVPEDEVVVEVSPVGKDRYKLEISQVHTWTGGDGGAEVTKSRNLDMEYRLATRVDPTWAAQINDKADRQRERARTVGRGCDRGCELGCRACETCARVTE